MTPATEETLSPDVKKLGELIKGIKIAMFTTVCADGALRSRPMATQQQEFDGDLWFFTERSAEKVREVDRDSHVNLAYADPGANRYISISGVAEEITDRAKAEALWAPAYKAWFPQGLEDPQLALIKVHVNKAEYWDGPSSKVVMLLGFAKAVLTGRKYAGGEHEKLPLP